jgi:ABC-type branched-subunit amino acid transport system ATPase component
MVGQALQVTKLSKSFGALAAVREVSFQVAPGTIHGIIGPNGAGKTSLFNLISGFLTPDQGTISVFGRSIVAASARDRITFGIARTFQNVAVYRDLTCVDNVILGLGQNGAIGAVTKSVEDVLGNSASRRRRECAISALESVGIGHLAQTRAGDLSLGNQRCLEIARAIVSSPKLLMLDEPVSGLEADEQRRIAELLRSINSRLGTTMLLIEHNVRFVVELSQKLSVMSFGALIAEGDPHAVIGLPEVRRIYFGETD